MSLLLSALLISSAPIPGAMFPPTNVNLSVVRQLECASGSGTGFVVEDNVIATANHVANIGSCYDAQTGQLYTVLHQDAEHDFALMTGKTLAMPLQPVSCQGYKKGDTYFTYGFSSFKQLNTLFRLSPLVAQEEETFQMRSSPLTYTMFRLSGYIVFGQSGSPVFDGDGRITGVVNIGDFDGNDNPTGKMLSTELKDTILCKSPQTSHKTNLTK